MKIKFDQSEDIALGKISNIEFDELNDFFNLQNDEEYCWKSHNKIITSINLPVEISIDSMIKNSIHEYLKNKYED